MHFLAVITFLLVLLSLAADREKTRLGVKKGFSLLRTVFALPLIIVIAVAMERIVNTKSFHIP